MTLTYSLFPTNQAYRGLDGVPRLFRPEMNVQRLLRSAERVALPVRVFFPRLHLSLLRKACFRVDDSHSTQLHFWN